MHTKTPSGQGHIVARGNVLDTKCSTLMQCRKGDAWNCLSLANKKNTILNNLISVLTHHMGQTKLKNEKHGLNTLSDLPFV